MNIPYPDEDSPDLSDEEVAGAIQSQSPKDVGQLIHLSCSSCGATPMAFAKHERRRRKPHHYWRVTLRCEAGHEVKKVLQMTWMQ